MVLIGLTNKAGLKLPGVKNLYKYLVPSKCSHLGFNICEIDLELGEDGGWVGGVVAPGLGPGVLINQPTSFLFKKKIRVVCLKRGHSGNTKISVGVCLQGATVQNPVQKHSCI